MEMENAAAVENSLVVPQKATQRITIWASKSTSRYILKRIENKDLNRYYSPIIHSSIIHNSQKVETTQMSINR